MKRIHNSGAHDTFTNIDHLLGDKENFSKSQNVGKKIEAVFSDTVKLEINIKSEKQKTITLNVKSKQIKTKHLMHGLKRKIKTEIADFLENND